jgi:hypothetical protein
MKNIKRLVVILILLFLVFVFAKNRAYNNEPDPKIVMVDVPTKELTSQDISQEVAQDKEKEESPDIEAIVKWQGPEPYPLDWSNTVPELKVAFDAFGKKMGSTLACNSSLPAT